MSIYVYRAVLLTSIIDIALTVCTIDERLLI